MPTSSQKPIQKSLRAACVALSVLLIALPASAGSRIVERELRLGAHIQGEESIRLNRAVPRGYVVDSVVVVAKSRHGRGRVGLQSGRRLGRVARVGGEPWSFNRRGHFDRVVLTSPRAHPDARLRLNLDGNFKVRKIIVRSRPVADRGRDRRERRDRWQRWDHHATWTDRHVHEGRDTHRHTWRGEATGRSRGDDWRDGRRRDDRPARQRHDRG